MDIASLCMLYRSATLCILMSLTVVKRRAENDFLLSRSIFIFNETGCGSNVASHNFLRPGY